MVYIITHLDEFEYVDRTTMRNYEYFNSNVILNQEEWRVFKEATVFPEYEYLTKLNGELVYLPDHRPDAIKWVLDDDGFYHHDPEDNDDFILSTLDFVLRENPIFSSQSVNGHVIKLNAETQEVDYYYKIVNNRLFYHTNYTIEYNDYYKKCWDFYTGDADGLFADQLLDLYNNFADVDTPSEIDDHPDDIFLNTYRDIRV